ncbi:hypothetical protein ACFLV9_00545 [Chloroflexota bacterium]
MGFNIIPGVGRARLTQLEKYFSNLEIARKVNTANLKQAGLDSGSIRAITTWRSKISLEAEMEKLDLYGVKVLTWHGGA